MPRTAMFLRRHAVGLGVLFILWLVFFSRILFGGQLYFLDDLKIFYYPLEVEYAEFQREAQLPLWSTHFGFGHPLLAWGQLGFFTPLHVLLRFFGIHPLILLQISVMAYLAAGLAGMYLFLRARKLAVAASTLGAATFAFSGFMIGHLNHVNFYTSTMLLPWLLLAIHSFIRAPRLVTMLGVAASASIITISGQPQIVLYTLVIAAIIGAALFVETYVPRQRFPKKRDSSAIKVLILTLVAAALALTSAAVAILPLMEFLPETERAQPLPAEELFDFSYPPYHAITLVFPYFFGDHSTYWGPKGFQELAAFVGIVPLLLAASSLTYLHRQRALRLAALILLLVGCLMATASYSPLYRFLVEHHYITSLSVPGRFVFFFDVAIVLLAALGLHDLTSSSSKNDTRRILPAIALGVAITFLLFVPFFRHAQTTGVIAEQLSTFVTLANPTWWLIILGLAGFAAVIISLFALTFGRYIAWILTIISVSTLLLYSWDYNPLSPREVALRDTTFTKELIAYQARTGRQPRLYASKQLLVQGAATFEKKLTDPISPDFTVYQPIRLSQNNLRCLYVPIHADELRASSVDVMLRESLSGTILYQATIHSRDIAQKPTQEICFPELLQSASQELVLSFSSDTPTGIRLFISPAKTEHSRVYFVRVASPSPQELARSRKDLTLVYEPVFHQTADIEHALLLRHLHVLADTSSARWIGALSIRPYREFIETFFANDTEAFDGDGVHALAKYREFLNMAGVTHLTQSLEYGFESDHLIAAGYNLVAEEDTGEQLVRLYENPQAYPPAFLVPTALWKSAPDEIRHGMMNDRFDPKQVVYISGPTPPDHLPQHAELGPAQARVARYTPTEVEVDVTATQEAVLVLTDSTTSQWKTYLNGEPTYQLQANSVFKAAVVPTGSHTVTFRYESSATRLAVITSSIGALVMVLLIAIQIVINIRKRYF